MPPPTADTPVSAHLGTVAVAKTLPQGKGPLASLPPGPAATTRWGSIVGLWDLVLFICNLRALTLGILSRLLSGSGGPKVTLWSWRRGQGYLPLGVCTWAGASVCGCACVHLRRPVFIPGLRVRGVYSCLCRHTCAHMGGTVCACAGVRVCVFVCLVSARVCACACIVPLCVPVCTCMSVNTRVCAWCIFLSCTHTRAFLPVYLRVMCACAWSLLGQMLAHVCVHVCLHVCVGSCEACLLSGAAPSLLSSWSHLRFKTALKHQGPGGSPP